MESRASQLLRWSAFCIVIFSFIILFRGRETFRGEINNYPENSSNYQGLKTETAVLVQEDLSFHPSLFFGSAFIINKQTGEFATVAHCVNLSGGSRLVLFHNRKIYECVLVKKFSSVDLAIIKINNFFRPEDLGDPLKMAPIVFVGETVWIRGLHWHSDSQDRFGGDSYEISDVRKHYLKFAPWLPKTNTGEDKDVIFENFEATVMDTACKIDLSAVPSIKLRTKKDHLDTFRGLSGAPVVNAADELVGIIFAAPLRSGWVDFFIGRVKYIPYDTLYIIPSCELEKLIFSSGGTRR